MKNGSIKKKYGINSPLLILVRQLQNGRGHNSNPKTNHKWVKLIRNLDIIKMSVLLNIINRIYMMFIKIQQFFFLSDKLLIL